MRTTSSPSRTPACEAIVCSAGGPSTARGSSVPLTFSSQYTPTASSRLASGPASTMAIRLATGCRLKARDRSASSAGSVSGSRSSSIRT